MDRDWEEGRSFSKGGKYLSKEIWTEKPCPENLEISICHELNHELGRTLRSSWGDTPRYLAR